MGILNSIYHWAIRFTGEIVIWFALAAAALILLEMIFYQCRSRKKPAGKKRVAVVTGASSGLGRELVRRIDRKEKQIDEIWLVARREERLQALADELQHPARIFALDLTEKASAVILAAALQREDAEVALLVCGAGQGKIGRCEDLAQAETDRMIDLNDRAAVEVTEALLPFLGSGSRILEICSTAAFQPLPNMNTYAASKAFLYRYSRGLRAELLPRRIAVTAVCPYWMKDTEFIPTARDTEHQTEKSGVRHFPFSTGAKTVARRALRSSRFGFAVSLPSLFSWIHRFFAKLIPSEVMQVFWEILRRI